MMPQTLQDFFGLYLVLAIGYNLFSLALLTKTGKGAAPTDPMTGILFVSVLYLVHATAGLVASWLYLFFLCVFTGLIFYFGILNHMLNYDEEKYLSRFTWLSAFSINGFGVAVLVLIIAKAAQ